MPNNLISPHNALLSWSRWRELPETQEVLNHLKAKAETARSEANRSPITFPKTETGAFMSLDMIRCLQDRQAGSVSGFTELSRFVDDYIVELQERIKQQDIELQEKQHNG